MRKKNEIKLSSTVRQQLRSLCHLSCWRDTPRERREEIDSTRKNIFIVYVSQKNWMPLPATNPQELVRAQHKTSQVKYVKNFTLTSSIRRIGHCYWAQCRRGESEAFGQFPTASACSLLFAYMLLSLSCTWGLGWLSGLAKVSSPHLAESKSPRNFSVRISTSLPASNESRFSPTTARYSGSIARNRHRKSNSNSSLSLR